MARSQATAPDITHLYRLFDCHDVLLYIGITVDLGSRWKRHMQEKPWWDQVRRTTTELHDTWEDARKAERNAIIAEYPIHNIQDVPAVRRMTRDLTRLLQAGEVSAETGMTALLWQLAEALADHLAKVPESAPTQEPLTEEIARQTAVRAEAPEPRPAQQSTCPADDRDMFDEIMRQDPIMRALDVDLLDNEPGHKLHPARKRLYEMLILAGYRGRQVGVMWTLLGNEGLTISRQTVHDWLAQAEKQGYVRRTGKPKSGRSRWIWVLPEGGEFDIPGWLRGCPAPRPPESGGALAR